MSSFRIAVLVGALAVVSAAVFAQTPGRVRGTITAIDGNMLSVKSREGRDLKIELAPNATFAYMKALKLSDIAPGTPLGTSAVKGPEGKIVARELHLFSKDRPIPNEGHRPWDLEPGSTMTNAMVTAMVRSNNGHELTLKYKDGTQQVIVPDNIPVVTAVDGDRSLLVAGQYAVIAVTTDAGGKMSATRVQITKDGVKPPQ
ncbi:MAG TPA: hypothetical protein VEL09_14930 [Burkholderiales bacterium]|nr:hypothetical protein [Burkholderiales bacterium]